MVYNLNIYIYIYIYIYLEIYINSKCYLIACWCELCLFNCDKAHCYLWRCGPVCFHGTMSCLSLVHCTVQTCLYLDTKVHWLYRHRQLLIVVAARACYTKIILNVVYCRTPTVTITTSDVTLRGWLAHTYRPNWSWLVIRQHASD